MAGGWASLVQDTATQLTGDSAGEHRPLKEATRRVSLGQERTLSHARLRATRMRMIGAGSRTVSPTGRTLRVSGATLLLGLLLSLLPFEAGAQANPTAEVPAEPGSELRVWLLTAEPGEAVWERFGHNAIRVLDTRTGRDAAYNWGIFDFNQVDFIPRFLKGEMLYQMAPFATGPMIESYARAQREVVLQELALTPAQRLALSDYAEWNALPENRAYFYDYFRDNCSTRVRDVLDQVLGGALFNRFGEAPTGTSYRYHIRGLTRSDPLLYTGMDVLLGSTGDQDISVWEEMFLPMTLRDAVRTVTVLDENGEERPLVMSEEIVSPGSGTTEAAVPPSWLPGYLLLGLMLGGMLAWTGILASRGSRAAVYFVGMIGTAWSLLVGLVGTIMVLALFTDHEFMAWNQTLFVVNPLSLALAVLIPITLIRGKAHRATSTAALAVVCAAALGVLVQVVPTFQQQNLIFLAWMVPTHIGLWFALSRLESASVPE